MSIFDIFSNKDIKEKQKELNDKVENYEKRVSELEIEIKNLTERFDEFNGLLKAQRSFPTPNNPQLSTSSTPDNVEKNDVKEGEKFKDTKNTPDNSEIKDNEDVKTELNELNSVKNEAPKRRGRPKKIDKTKQEQTLEEVSSKTNVKVEKTKTKQSKKPKSKNTKTNTKRGRKPKSTIEENKIETTTPPKRRGRPKKTAEPIPDAAVMGLDFDEPVEEKPVEKKENKRAKPIKVDKNRKIESFADIVELTNKDE